MSTRFYYGQKDYITQLNLLDDAFQGGPYGSLPIAGGTLTGPAITSAGSVGAPSLGVGSSTSGLYRPAANQIGVSISGVNVATFSSTGLSLPNLNEGPIAGLRNYLINGCMRLHQRTGSIVIAAGGSAYTLDRWTIFNGTNAAITVTQSTMTNFDSADVVPRMRISANTTPTTGSVFISQRIEGVHVLANTPATMSLLIASADVGMQARFLYSQNFGSGGSAAAAGNYGYYSLGATVNTAQPSRQSQVFTTPTTVGKTFGAGNFLEVTYEMALRTTNGHTISQVQFEKGSTATPFEYRPIGLELGLCQRYFQLMGPVAGRWQGSTTSLAFYYSFPTAMRAAPTASYLGSVGVEEFNVAFRASSGVTTGTSSTAGFSGSLTTAAATSGNSGGVAASTGTTGVAFNAEL